MNANSLSLCLSLALLPPPLAAEVPSKDQVRETQILLLVNEFDPGPIDGVLGEKTKRAIRRYEAKHNWPITGLISTGLTERLRSETQDRLALNEPKEVPLDSKKNQVLLEQEIVDIKRSIQELRDKKPQDSKGTKNMLDWLDLIGLGSTFVIGILGIVLALMSLAGYAVYRLVRFTLETKHDKLFAEHVKLLADGAIKIRATVYMNLSRAFYLYYRSFYTTDHSFPLTQIT